MGRPEETFNRSDCPYGCGTPLPPNLRWQATPCRGCRRPLHPLAAIRDDAGRELWPPAHVPRPSTPAPPGTTLWYVVGEEEFRERSAIMRARHQESETAVQGFVQIAGLTIVALVVGVVNGVVRVIRTLFRR